MDIRQRIIAPCASWNSTRDDVEVDLDGFLERLVLFDHVVVQTIRLQEFRHFVHAFGYDGLMELLSAGIMEIESDMFVHGSVGQSKDLGISGLKRPLPLGSYRFGLIRPPNWKQFIHERLQDLHSIDGLSIKQIKKLKSKVARKIRTPEENPGGEVGRLFLQDLRTNSAVVNSSIRLALAAQADIRCPAEQFTLHVEEFEEESFRVETDLQQKFGLDETQCHKVVEKGLLGVAGLNTRLYGMKRFNALSGCLEQDLPLIDEKLGFLSGGVSPERQSQRFRRVLEIKGFPRLAANTSTKVNIRKLLEIRQRPECTEFRQWLMTLDAVTDAEIADQLKNLRGRLGDLVCTTAGKAVRFLVSASAGFGPGGMLLAPGISVLDTFLLERLLPRSGPTAFVNRLYPSVFEGGRRT